MATAAHTPEAEVKKPAINLNYMRDKEREMVKGIFKFYEVPGGRMEFSFKKYKGDEVKKYDFVDGQIYTIPLGVAKHLNNNCWYSVHAHATDEDGKPVQKIGQKIHRCGFQSLDFMEIEGLTATPVGIITVENL